MTARIVSDACRNGGARNALLLAEFRDEHASTVQGALRQRFLMEAFRATFEMPSEADKECRTLRVALRNLAHEWSK